MNLAARLTLLLLLSGSGGVALAQKTTSASLNVSSSMTQNTCYINGVQQSGASVTSIAVRMPTVTRSDFASAGQLGPVVVGTTTGGFNISLTSCPANAKVALALDGTGSIDSATGTYKNTTTGGAANMNVQIVNAENGVNTALSPTGANNVTKTTNASGSTGFLLGVRYYASAAVSAGAFTATAGFNITYP